MSRPVAKAHLKDHYRRLDGVSAYIRDHDEAHSIGRPAKIHERIAIGKHKSGTHYLRAVDSEDGLAIQESAKRLGHALTKRRAGANHFGRVGAYDHWHVEDPKHALAILEDLKCP